MHSVESDWDDWLPRAVAEADPDGLALWYLGFNGLAVKHGETTLFVDPYLGTGDPPRTVRACPVPFAPGDVRSADALLVTHEHTDHVHGPSQAPLLANTGAPMYAPERSLAVARDGDWTDHGVDPDQFRVVAPGEEFAVGDVSVTVTAANDPDADQPVGYVLETPAATIYHGGDARPGEASERVGRTFDVDLAAVAVGSAGMIPDKQTGEPRYTKWYNDENAAVECARQLRAERLLPTHFDAWRGLTADPTALVHHARGFEYPRRVLPVEVGDRVDLG
jgi:L-ascorbate 6-phosphate lactonase